LPSSIPYEEEKINRPARKPGRIGKKKQPNTRSSPVPVHIMKQAAAHDLDSTRKNREGR
jgi:hypothetical protein